MAHRLTSQNVVDFWSEAWANNNTGWKIGETGAPFTRILFAYLKETGIITTNETRKENAENAYHCVCHFLKGKTVFVPLCGDSAVLSYMIKCGVKHIIGADLSEHALYLQKKCNFPEIKFNSKSLKYIEGSVEGEIILHEAIIGESCVYLFQGDIIELPNYKVYNDLKVDFMYDRAAMMAIPPDLRELYIKSVTKNLLPTAGIAYERMVRLRPENKHLGPPFMIDIEEVKKMYYKYTGREYEAKLILTEEEYDARRAEWYALLPKVS